MLNVFHFRLFEILGYLFNLLTPFTTSRWPVKVPFLLLAWPLPSQAQNTPWSHLNMNHANSFFQNLFLNFDAKRMKQEAFFWVKIYEVSKMIIITRENIISTKIVVTFSEFLRRFRNWFPFYHTMSLSRGIFAFTWPNFDLEAPLAPRAVPTLMS